MTSTESSNIADPFSQEATDESISAVALGASILRGRRSIVRFSILCSIAVALQSVFTTDTFTVAASFQPQTRKSEVGAGLAGIAAQFGVAVPGSEGTQTTNFYLALLRSRTLANQIIDESYQWVESGAAQSGTLIKAFKSKGSTAAIQRDEAIIELQKLLQASVNPKNGLVTFDVKTTFPELSFAIANTTLRKLNEFNLLTRQNQATAERRFAEKRLVQVRGELLDLQEDIETFIRKNRLYAGSPELQFQFERLRDELSVRKQVYAMLSQAVEQAKIEETRDLPVLTIVDHPEMPARRDSKHVIPKTFATLVISLLTAVIFVMFQMLIRSGSVSDLRMADELKRLRLATSDDFRRPWRLLFGKP